MNKIEIFEHSLALEVFKKVIPFIFSQDRIFLCNPSWPGTHCVEQLGLDLGMPGTHHHAWP